MDSAIKSVCFRTCVATPSDFTPKPNHKLDNSISQCSQPLDPLVSRFVYQSIDHSRRLIDSCPSRSSLSHVATGEVPGCISPKPKTSELERGETINWGPVNRVWGSSVVDRRPLVCPSIRRMGQVKLASWAASCKLGSSAVAVSEASLVDLLAEIAQSERLFYIVTAAGARSGSRHRCILLCCPVWCKILAVFLVFRLLLRRSVRCFSMEPSEPLISASTSNGC